MQVETLPVNDRNKKTRKHDFHTIATSKNISKEKINFINKELNEENDFKVNLNPNTSKTKKVKNSLNSVRFILILFLSNIYYFYLIILKILFLNFKLNNKDNENKKKKK